ncbi:MAG TPA: M24 family metallopeptidase [Polyangiales bacterium]|jgi:Xaa-Pro aminopeptidase|nr:M24 family metallopeptidase [Polyangiales bacterium]
MPMLKRFTQPFTPERQALELQPEHVEGFRRAQRLSYDCAVAVEQFLVEGITELRVAELMRQYLADHGVREYFHTPFVWFGERTAFVDFKTDAAFAPSTRELRAGDPVILDVAPVVDGHAADIGYACGNNEIQAQMVDDLLEYRGLILEGVKARKTRSDIYRDCDQLIQKQGYENRHQRYSNRVLGHRVMWTPPEHRSEREIFGFGVQAFGTLIMSGVLARFQKGFDVPIWNDLTVCDAPPAPGLWAIEPHVGLRGIGAKWEELLVVTEHDAYWIDDDVPHVHRALEHRRQAAAGAAKARGARAAAPEVRP